MAVAVGSLMLAGCASSPNSLPGARQPGRPAVKVSSAGCLTGTYRLDASPGSVHRSQLVTLSASGSRLASETSLDSWGSLGTARDGHFAGVWYLAAITPGGQAAANIPAGSPNTLVGSDIPNVPFKIRMPDVPAGSYMIQWRYNTNAAVSGRSASYTLCAAVRVAS
jgi:hypothetical protein